MTKAERTRLAEVGLRSILPWEREGTDLLREVRLPAGGPAFREKEIAHMGDVRRLIWVLFAIHAAGIAALAGLALWRRTRPVARPALKAGALATLGIAAFVGVFVLISPVGFLGGFHRVFFSGDSWRFAEADTLRRLFPDRFWSDTATVLGVGTALQAAVLLAASWLPGRKGRERERTAPHAG